jgi:hypothetical protein
MLCGAALAFDQITLPRSSVLLMKLGDPREDAAGDAAIAGAGAIAFGAWQE